MNKTIVEVPTEIKYLSEWSELDASLPQGKIIVNKIICGCGMTDYYLTNDIPVILASPRRELIVSKTKEPRTQHAYYFDRSDTNVDLQTSKDRLITYFSHPFRSGVFVPKIMCTYDSLKSVIDVLVENGLFDAFTVIGDEMTCIFTDAKMKGSDNMELVNLISQIPNRCIFITATPLKEPYLDQVPVFKDMTYVSFEWPPERLEKICLKKQKMDNTKAAICGIIESFKERGCFNRKIVNGEQIDSTEAVFFINSVKDIIDVVKKAGLTGKNTRVVCADTPENKRRLEKVHLQIGHFPSRLEYNDADKKRPFTFATKCSFEGADLHSDSASIYVFADSNRENLSLDISIDLPQIIGRCRTQKNPFRHDIQYYYKTTNAVGFDLREAKEEIQAKIDKTTALINKMNGWNDPDIIEKFRDAQAKSQYQKDYVDVVSDGQGGFKLAENSLVILADFRAVEIAHEQYSSNYSVLCYLKDNGYDAINYHAQGNSKFAQFLRDFDAAGCFEEKMKVFVNGCIDPEVVQGAMYSLDIPIKFQRYYAQLGASRIKALAFKEIALKREILYVDSKNLISEQLQKLLYPGQIIELADLKITIQQVYNNLKLTKKAKATDILEYFPNSVLGKITDRTGKRKNAYKIL